MIGLHVFHTAGKKYLDAIRLAGCLPLIVAPCPDAAELEAVLALADGVLLPGSPSNVHPSHFGEAVDNPELPLDPDRDGLTLPLIRAALERQMPLFAICRGLQEVNVALGGSLYQAVHLQDGKHDHRENTADTAEAQYGPAHEITVQAGGLLERVLGQVHLHVNSLHGQGIKRLAPGLKIEALAHDGLIEAFSAGGSHGFLLALQWHPEWQAAHNPVSTKLFKAFGEACQTYRNYQNSG
jgi:putative glutamine amidotransferase